MKKYFLMLIFSLATVLLANNILLSQEKYIVSGSVQSSGPNTIILCLYDQNTWPISRKELAPAPFTIISKADEFGKINFTFKQVPKGDYIIKAFVDKNDNKKADVDGWGFPVEPVTHYKPTNELLNWNDQKFTVDKDINDIFIQFK